MDGKELENIKAQRFEMGTAELVKHIENPDAPLTTKQEFEIQLGKHEFLHGRNFDLEGFDTYQTINLLAHGHEPETVQKAIKEATPNVEATINNPKYGEQVMENVMSLAQKHEKVAETLARAPEQPASPARAGEGILTEMAKEQIKLEQMSLGRSGTVGPPLFHHWDAPGGGGKIGFKGVDPDIEPWE